MKLPDLAGPAVQAEAERLTDGLDGVRIADVHRAVALTYDQAP